MKHTSPRNGFTLIELLVVISIIALLAGLAFPALQGALDTAKKAQASTMVNQLATAITMYNTEYGVWPLKSGDASDTVSYVGGDFGAVCLSLNGGRRIDGTTSGTPDVSNLTIPNTRGIQFMSFNKKDLKSGSTTGADNEVMNPYSKAKDLEYRLLLDGDYNGTVSAPDVVNGSGTTYVSQGVAIWCYGDKNGTQNKYITSYK